MESEFPSNSRRPVREEKPKKIERVVQGEVQRRKKPLSKKISEAVVGGDARGVWSFIAFEVLVPAFKDTFTDAVSQGVERLVFGEARSSSRRTGGRPGHINYQSRYAPAGGRREEPRYQMSRRARANHEFDEIILPTRVEAEEVVDRLFDIVNRYETATVADLYELVGISGNYTDDKWGWSDLRGAGVQRVRNGYLLDLPRPEPLD